MYHLENEAGDHSVGLKLALKDWVGTEPDMVIITEDGSKVYTKSIILSMYSKTLCNVIADYKTLEMPNISLPVSSSDPVLNLLKILTEGIVLSTDSNALLEVGKVAQMLDIKLEGVQLGSRKKSTTKTKKKEARKQIDDSNDENEPETENNKDELDESDGQDADVEMPPDIKQEMDQTVAQEGGSNDAKPCIARGQKNCDECGKVFTTKQALERHVMSIHTGERPFKCDECEKGFTNVFSMNQHKVSHSDVKPYECHCGVKFTLKASLKRHELKTHNVDE